jgi:uncharacterized protein YjbI with pentapeptide repeats
MNYQEVFASNPGANGSPDDPAPAGFLALALAGREIWNAWRADYPTEWEEASQTWRRAVRWTDPRWPQNPVQLASVPDIQFSGFNFGDGADFSNQRVHVARVVKFDDAAFGDGTRFYGTVFSNGVSFRRTCFGRRACFTNLQIEGGNVLAAEPDWICFEGAKFGDEALLDHLRFYWQQSRDEIPQVSFKGCTFGDRTRILVERLEPSFRSICFDGSKFGNDANLSRASFGESAFFRHCIFGNNTSFAEAMVRAAEFSESQFASGVNFRGDEFGAISFVGTCFGGLADFSNRKFTARANFRKARFGTVPLFHNCELHQDTAFDDDSFPEDPVGTGEASRAYRTLKLAMSKHQATREEQFFFRREMREERLELWQLGGFQRKLRSILYALYGGLSDYGVSVRRPIFWFFACVIAFATMYAGFSESTTLWMPGRAFDGLQTLRWLTYSFVNSLPLGGLDDASRELRKVLLPLEVSPWLSIALAFHKILSLLFLFLIGLALRNIFKMK